MAARRPFASRAALFAAADELCAGLEREDWLEAFGRHPPIGEKRAAAETSATERRWSEQEQSAAARAAAETLTALAEANRAYRERYGYLFIVCAAGKSAEEMLALLRQRLQNDPGTELGVAAEEQRRIARLRLEKLLEE
jgi:OHCU decarboxylase